jgi:hypothetical protein
MHSFQKSAKQLRQKTCVQINWRHRAPLYPEKQIEQEKVAWENLSDCVQLSYRVKVGINRWGAGWGILSCQHQYIEDLQQETRTE